MQILLIVEDMQLGGVERTCATLANFWVKEGHQVSLITFEKPDAKPLYELHRDIHFVRPGDLRQSSAGMKFFGSIFAIFRLRKILIQELKKKKGDEKSVILGFLPHMCVYSRMASFGLNAKMISSVRIFPAFDFTHSNRLFHFVRFLAYIFSNHIVIQTEAGKSYFPEVFRSRISVIPNSIIEFSDTSNSPALTQKNPFVLAVGRLAEQKRFDLLIESFSRIASKFPSWNLLILGDGELRSQLHQLIETKNLSKRVYLLGRIENVKAYYEQAEFLAMASDFEGFPNALTEAMSCGLPAIFTDCPSGPREIIRDKVDGLLVPLRNVEALSSAMEHLMLDESLRKKMGEAARQNIQRFNWPTINAKWIDLFHKL
ncbi:MAG: glycosyl transferase, group 1 [Bacteriovoracaceae bacterium]|nr:glycosyl transferase, group 1 [Bacteriovoracaceae bacterium]